MKKLVIAVHEDNQDRNQEALSAAMFAIEEKLGRPVYRAWIETTSERAIDLTVQSSTDDSKRGAE